ncbi:MAG: hypothetical protein DLM69_01865 [Candidatus Chloroheliales bacterium]|nr:MAG: hypothetical protein DLM69_01865 [Chloroflexota bacterium]
MSNVTEANPAWPDTLDPEPNAEEQAWLASGPLTLARIAPSALADLAASEVTVTQVRRFDWPRLQTKPNRALLAVLLIAFGGFAWRFWDEFNGSWILSWPLVIWLALALLTFNFLLGRHGEDLPLIGRSYAEAKPAGLKLRLFYGRCLAARRFFHGWFNLFMLTWPRRYYIPWREVEQVGLFTADYGLRVGTLYWVRIWSRDRYSYTVLVTPNQQQASELADLIVGQAHLGAWAELGEHSTDLLNPDLGVLSKDDHFRWRTDRRRISVHGAYSSVSARLWRTPDPQPSRLIAIRPTWRAAVKLTVAIALMLVALNYDYLISLSIWPPSSANLSINNPMPIPPLHEIWHTSVTRDYNDTISFGGGKIALVNEFSANIYDAASGKPLSNPHLNGVSGCYNRHGTISEDGNYLYYVAYKQDKAASNQTCNDTPYEMVAFSLQTNSVIWKHPVSSNGLFVLQPKLNLVVVGGYGPNVEALNLQTGALVWQSKDLSNARCSLIAVGGDSVYAELGGPAATLVALNIKDGVVRWTKTTQHAYELGADAQRVYVMGSPNESVYSSNGDALYNQADIHWVSGFDSYIASSRLRWTEDYAEANKVRLKAIDSKPAARYGIHPPLVTTLISTLGHASQLVTEWYTWSTAMSFTHSQEQDNPLYRFPRASYIIWQGQRQPSSPTNQRIRLRNAMSITEEANSVEADANRTGLAVEPLRPASPDAIDPEPSAAERARLANGPLALTRAATQPGGLALIGEASLPRRFVWPRLQAGVRGIVILALIWPLYWCTTSAWSEFVGTWVLSWGLALPLVGFLVISDVILVLLGERLPLIGRSWVELRPEGVRVYLFYGRKPAVRGKGFRIFGLVWPCRATIPWADVARVAVYRADYENTQRGPRRTMYWVKLWTNNGTGYVALITDMEAQAHELANLLAQHAGLSKWAYLNGNDSSIINPSLGPLDRDTLFIWRADQRRISNATTIGSVNAELWRAPFRELMPRVGGLRWRTLVKLTLLVVLLIAIFNYDYLLSYLLWTPPGPIASDPAWLGGHHDAGNTNASNQTLIPPLHEVWHTKLEYGSATNISLGGGKLLVTGESTAYAYDASSGKLLNQYKLFDSSNPPGYNEVITGTISPDGNYAYFVSINMSVDRISGVEKTTYQRVVLDLNTSSQIWQQTLSGNPTFLFEPKRNLIITSSPVTTNTNGTTSYDYVIEALNPQTGAQVWHSEGFGAVAPNEIAVGGDNVYAATDGGDQIVALNIGNGTTRWKKGNPVTFADCWPMHSMFMR